ncbi:hypothetical protein [Hafnia phage yong2]|uniref:hypothetical protein n=1 Tax=Hafnia paralvei TaxID=546367 RepID=UPI0018F0C457|nr:hypothetical protein [Hafnia paralvei]MBW2958071.1 hypothetical protein [Hafnia paralvei]QXN68756.1 hypothetical protein [Hafnia phage yong2]
MTHISEIPAGTLVKQAHAGVKLIAEQYPEAAAVLREAITRFDVLREVHQLAKQEAQPVIPEGLIKAINRLLDNDGSRGCFDALEQHRAKTELELLLAAAQQNEPQNIPAQPVIPERPELRYGDNVLWFLNELAAFDASDIDSDDFDVYGEDRNGIEGCATISITELAADAAKLLSAQPVSNPYKSAANDIIAERQRQIIEEGWTPERDDSYSCGELAGAAACYARYTNARGWVFPTNPTDYQSAGEPLDWPWDAEWWKPSNPRRDLVKAGALILAEIERMDRIAPAQESE